MNPKASNLSSWIALIPAVLVLGAILAHTRQTENEAPHVLPEHFRTVIEMTGYTDTSRTLAVGYNYHLLKKFASDNNAVMDIELGNRSIDWLDSLRNGAIDILVLPYEDSLDPDKVIKTIPVDSIAYWLLRHDRKDDLMEINTWIASYHASEDYEETREMFMHTYSAYRSGRRKYLCPYDGIIKERADSIGWDWRMLAALIYTESHFHIEAKSSKGAQGLMQMMPGTAGRYGVSNLLDPEESIVGASKYLARLSDRYTGIAADKKERFKFTLGAYNAGEGRIKDCIQMARDNGIEPEYWDDIVSIIPQMRDSSVLGNENIALGMFKGGETIKYVEGVMDIYTQFLRICP